MTNIILSVFAAFLAALASLMVLWFVQDAPEAVTAKSQSIAAMEAQQVVELENIIREYR